MDGFQIVKVDGDGSCLYHAVATAFACSGAEIPNSLPWIPGVFPASAGKGSNSLRRTLERFSRDLAVASEGIDRLCNMWENVDQDTVGCGIRSTEKLIQRIADTPRWAEWEEVALLSLMLDCNICVYHRVNGKFVTQRNCANRRGLTKGSEFDVEVGPKKHCGHDKAVRLRVVCQDSTHFDALIPDCFFNAEQSEESEQ